MFRTVQWRFESHRSKGRVGTHKSEAALIERFMRAVVKLLVRYRSHSRVFLAQGGVVYVLAT